MAKGLMNRLDYDNIVQLSVNTEDHSASGNVFDAEGNAYPIGGGGGGYDIHTCTVTFNNTSGSAISIASSDRMKLLPLQDDGTIEIMSAIPEGETVAKLMYLTTGGGMYVAIGFDTTATASDAVNCALIPMAGNVLGIEDITKDSSITLTYSGSD